MGLLVILGCVGGSLYQTLSALLWTLLCKHLLQPADGVGFYAVPPLGK